MKRRRKMSGLASTAIGMGISSVALSTTAGMTSGLGGTVGANSAKGLENVSKAMPAMGTIAGAGATIGMLRKIKTK